MGLSWWRTQDGEVVAGRRGNGVDWFEPIDLLVDGAGSLLVSTGGGVEIWRPGVSGAALLLTGNWPTGIALAADGALLFADTFEHTVSRWHVSDDDRVHEEVVAGRSVSGVRRGASLRQLERPFGVAVDSDGAVLVADSGNHRIVRWAPGASQGVVVAGGNGQGSRLNQLSHPRGLALELDGSLLVSDTFNHRVVRWRRGATCGELVAGGHGCGFRLDQTNRPVGLALDGLGSLYIADSGNHRVLRCAAGY